ncbi:MAG: bifunctional DNA-formamidopyrimidine glycosylase/DNA-(apurinic or apyrimidinic site) lyase [Thermoflexales bacterium]|nr:bifunctional DNA-formamidopyrimidine glycosylase/DNA-(apurinic or apyrimidinic site) lyase [Thermoflexales bacterium]
MPELPEVETIARTLRAGTTPLLGRAIQRAEVRWPREVTGMSAAAFEARLRGARVEAIGRHGKYLVLALPPAGHLLIHLRMSGRLDVVAAAEADTPHARVLWWLDDGHVLRFDDARKFGRVWLVDDPAEVLQALGPDALDLGVDDFRARLAGKRGALKPLLLDQRVVAGIGNIYADEALWRARLSPLRAAAGMRATTAGRLHAAVQEALHAGLAANGASIDWVYPGGNFQNDFKAYGRTGQPCLRCGRPIRRIVVGQRATHFCPHCQT